MFELYVILTNMYWLMCVMQSQKLRKVDKIFCNLSIEEHRTLMEMLQNDKSGEYKRNPYEFFLEFIIIFYLRIFVSML